MRYVDLSHPIESGMPVYPGSDAVAVEPVSTIEAAGTRVTSIEFDTHAGTHVDAPNHMIPGGDAIDDFDPGAFVFDAKRVDCTGKGPRAAITVDDLPSPSEHDFLALWTGWEDHWGSPRYRDHPYLSPRAAEWCVDHGYSVGIDAFSPDPTPSADPDGEGDTEPAGYPAHETLLGADRQIVENLIGLSAVPSTFTLHAYPLPVSGADGSPVRAVAVVE